jgi:hypothetical protein
MQSPDCRRYAPLSGAAKHPAAARPSQCIIITSKLHDGAIPCLFILEVDFHPIDIFHPVWIRCSVQVQVKLWVSDICGHFCSSIGRPSIVNQYAY